MRQSASVTAMPGPPTVGDELAPGLLLEERVGGGKRTEVFSARRPSRDLTYT